ncbi:ABC transporter ATP-binding protein [Alloscardovia theropitheci]|uniref:Fatty acid ABC transporter ATP-binding/permease protein n=1 Tax=Alloscardovia theropitheci TaxID=2496842 RepID=A0A4R0QTU3_9BIFI|nr:ABC transporter ATP-binding protein [Alloscardovia theropitheci]TCD54745.1 ABC transporter ATP-binding protein [Alloscardovia theropitheci]
MARNSVSPVAKKGQRSRTLGRLIGYLFHESWRMAVMILAGIVGVALIVLAPKVLARGTDVLFSGILGSMLKNTMHLPDGTPMSTVVDMLKQNGQGNLATMLSSYNVEVGKGVDWNAFLQIILITVGIYVLGIIFRFIQNFTMARITTNVVYRMRNEIAEKIDRLPLSYFDRVPRGEVMSRTTNDVDNVQQSLQQMLSEFFFSIFQFIATVIMMLTISPMLTLIAMIVIPVLLLVISGILKLTQPQFVKQWDSTGKVNSHVEEMFSGHMVVRAYGQESRAEEDFDEYNKDLYKSSFFASFMSSLMNPLTSFAGNVSFIIVAVYGGLRVINGQLTLGDLQAFTQYSRQTTQPLGQLASMGSMLQSAIASSQRIFEFLDAEEEQQEDPLTPTLASRVAKSGGVQGHVEFDHVAFSYNDKNPLIQDLSIDAKPGETIAIVGPTGAGKTTLVNLLMRFYEINSGSIRLDGVKTNELTRQDLRSHFGMVLQDTWLFEGTIRDNLFYGVHDKSLRTEDRLLEAARATHVDEFVRRLPNGYDTIMSDDSSELSQGEKQLLTICRAYLSDPDILILDEATSSVDTRTEMKVQTAMNTLRTGRTAFVIAHRLSTIRDADKILVVNKGNIVEQGNHDELLAQNGVYANMYNSQFAGKSEDN